MTGDDLRGLRQEEKVTLEKDRRQFRRLKKKMGKKRKSGKDRWKK